MKKIDGIDPLARSADPVALNVERLAILFPEAVAEGKVDIEVLRQLVGDKIAGPDQGYGLHWQGKSEARLVALTPTTGTLRPLPDEGMDWDKTQNIFVEGDNLEVLKLLQKGYLGRVKLIYIDPPYNTGNEFIYPDDFKDGTRNYLRMTGQVGEAGERLGANSESDGRYHSKWLSMMLPRLILARDLLSSEGVIFVSIDDNEVHNLRQLMDQVFGTENFIATIIWQKVYAPKSSAKHFSEDHDYVVLYAKSADTWRPEMLPRTDQQNAIYKNPDNDPRGLWRANNLAARNYYSKGTYRIVCPGGRVIAGPPAGSYWRISEDRFRELNADGRIWWGEDGNNVPAPKIFLTEVKDGRVPQTLWKYEAVGHTQEAKRELLDHVAFASSDGVFDTPKPTRLIEQMLRIGTRSDEADIVLDFFAGSGTTGEAVYKLNRDDGGNRRFIVVQLPEPTGQPDFKTIAEITKERLRRAGAKLKAENPLFGGDLGFRVYKLDSTNLKPWDQQPAELEKQLELGIDHVKLGRSEADLLTELLLKLGLELTVLVEEHTVAGHKVYVVGLGALIACLSRRILRSDAEPLAFGIAELHKALRPAGLDEEDGSSEADKKKPKSKPARESTTLIFRDAAFEDDVAKANLAAILEQRGLKNLRSL